MAAAGVALALLLVLLVPVRVVLRLEADRPDGVAFSVAWRQLLLHGSRRRRWSLPAGPAHARPPLDAAPPRPAPPLPRSAAAVRREDAPAPAAARTTPRDRFADLARATDVVRRMVARRALRVARLEGWLEFALHDVAETGRAFGYACTIATLLDPHGRVALRPRWDAEVLLAADLRVELRVHPLRALLALAGAHLQHGRRTTSIAAAPAGGAVAL
jgi:hypothetical protein